MTEKVLGPFPYWHFDDEEGRPAAGYQIFFYEAGTTTKATTWTDHTGLTPNTNPAICDANGNIRVWLPPLAPQTVTPNPPGPPGPQGPPGIPGPPGATGNTAEFSNTTDFTSAAVYNSFYDRGIAAPLYVSILPSQGANVIAMPVMIAINYHYATIPYATNGGNFVISWGPPVIPIPVSFYTISNGMLEDTEDEVQLFPDQIGNVLLTAYGATGAADKPLTLSFSQPIDGAVILAAVLADGGGGYVNGDTGTFDGGDGNATYTVLTTMGGAVLTFSLDDGGTAYSSTSGNATTATTGIGTGFTADTTSSLTTAGTMRVTVWYRKITLLT